MKKLNKKGFTLIELLAVIVILGLLMAIAIPSVTKYITQSRKKTLVSSIDSFVSAVTASVNDNEYGALNDRSKLYYIPVSNIEEDSCISLEKGGKNPFGDWEEAYVVVHYNTVKFSYDYYFTFRDKAGYGMALTPINEIDAKGTNIVNPMPSVVKDDITGQVGDTGVIAINADGSSNIVVFKKSGNTCVKSSNKVENDDSDGGAEDGAHGGDEGDGGFNSEENEPGGDDH